MSKSEDNLILENSPLNNSIDEIEQFVLAIMLNEPSSISEVIGTLESNDFFNSQNRAIFAAIKDYYQKWNSFDYKLMISSTQNSDKFLIDDLPATIIKIMNLYVDSYDLTLYLDFLKMNSTVKHLKKFGKWVNEEVKVDYYKYNDEIWELQKKFLDIINSKMSSKLINTQEITKEFADRLEHIKAKSGQLTGTTSGFKEVDEFTNGFQPGDLIILAARPSIGKTALALNMLLAASKKCKSDECVVFFSLEMGAQQLTERLVSAETSINSNSLKKGTWSDEDEFLIGQSLEKIKKLPILIDESSNLSILELQTKLKQIATNKKIKMIVVDYLQLVQGSNRNNVNRQQEVGQISRTLKSIARDVESPLIAVAQLSRRIEERKGADKKPILSDLRESGSIEQDADMVIFLNYEKDEIDNNFSNENIKQYNSNVIVDFIIAKHRNGSTGEVKLLFEKQYGRYSNSNIKNTN